MLRVAVGRVEVYGEKSCALSASDGEVDEHAPIEECRALRGSSQSMTRGLWTASGVPLGVELVRAWLRVSGRCLRLWGMPRGGDGEEKEIFGRRGWSCARPSEKASLAGRVMIAPNNTEKPRLSAWTWLCHVHYRRYTKYRLYSEPRPIRTSVVWYRETLHVSEH